MLVENSSIKAKGAEQLKHNISKSVRDKRNIVREIHTQETKMGKKSLLNFTSQLSKKVAKKVMKRSSFASPTSSSARSDSFTAVFENDRQRPSEEPKNGTTEITKADVEIMAQVVEKVQKEQQGKSSETHESCDLVHEEEIVPYHCILEGELDSTVVCMTKQNDIERLLID